MTKPNSDTHDAPTGAVLRRLALMANGMTGADIERLVREARQTARRQQRPLTYGDIQTALAGTRPARSASMRRRIAIHEAGHAVVRLALGVGSIVCITIETHESLGFVEVLGGDPVDTERQCLAALQVLLAGRAAEEVVFGDAMSGSGGSVVSDLGRATALACAMEMELGHSSAMPLLYRDSVDYHTALRADPNLTKRVNGRLETACAGASDLIRCNGGAHQILVEALLCSGTLEGQELKAVLAVMRERMMAPDEIVRTA
jgi:cell division protease FtsH